MPRYRLSIMIEEEIEAEDEEQAQEVLYDMYANFSWAVAEIEPLDEQKEDDDD